MFNELVGRDFRPVQVSGYTVAGEDRYVTIWEKVDGPSWCTHDRLTAAQYEQKSDELVGRGFRPVQVSGYAVGGEDRYAAIWEQRDGPPFAACTGVTAAEFQRAIKERDADGYRLVQVSGYAVGGEDRYAAIWEQRDGPPSAVRTGLTSDEFQRTFNGLVTQGYRLVQVSGYAVGGEDRYAAIWEKRDGPSWYARHGLTSAQYEQLCDDLDKQGYRLLQVKRLHDRVTAACCTTAWTRPTNRGDSAGALRDAPRPFAGSVPAS